MAEPVALPTPDSTTMLPMRRRWKFGLIAAGGLSVLAGISWLTIPVVVRWKVQAALHAAGYPDASIGRLGLGWSSADLDHVVLDARRSLTVDRIHVLWRWRDLLAGRLRRVDLDGLTVTLDATSQGLDVAPLMPAPGMASDGNRRGEIPVDRVVLIAGQWRLRAGSREELLAISGVLVDAGEGNAYLQGHAQGELGLADLQGTFAVASDTPPDLRLDLRDIAVARAAALAGHPGLPAATLSGRCRWDGSGSADLDLLSLAGKTRIHGRWSPALDRTPGFAEGSVEFQEADVAALYAGAARWLPPLPIRQPTGHATGSLAWRWSPGEWSLAGTVALREASATTEGGMASLEALHWAGRISDTGTGIVPIGTVSFTGLRGQAPVLGPLTIDEGRLSGHGTGWTFHLTGHAGSAQTTVDGDADPTGSTIAARVMGHGFDLGTWASRLPLPMPVTLNGLAGFSAQVGRAADRWQGTMTVDAASALLADPGGAWQATAEHLAADGRFAWQPGMPPTVQAVLRLDQGSLSAAGATIRHLAGTFPWNLGPDSGLSGELTGEALVAGTALPVRLRARLTDHTLRGRGDVRLFDLLDAGADGAVTFAAGGVTADLTVSLPRTVIDDPNALAKALGPTVPALAGLKCAGAVSASGTLSYRGGALTPTLHVDVRDGSLSLPSQQISAEGLELKVDLLGLAPWRTGPDQEFAAREVRWKGQVGTRLGGWWGLNDRRITVRQWGVDWADGRIGCPLMFVDLDAHRVVGDACATKIDLGILAALASPNLLSGGGHLTGQIPVTVDWSRPWITLGDGFCRADPPEGWLRFADRAQIAAWIGDGGVVDADLRRRLVDALQDFRFHRLELTTRRESTGGLLTRMVLGGQGRTGEAPLELGSLTCNIRGLEDGLVQLLRLPSSLPAPAKPPAPDTTLDRFFGP